jgi:quinoprotein glucose dehydrogenase
VSFSIKTLNIKKMKKQLLLFGLILSLSACGDNEKNKETAKAEEEKEVNQETNPVPKKQPEAVSPEKTYEYEVVAENITIPWGFDFLPDGSMLVTAKNGEIFHVVDGEKKAVSGAPDIYNQGQGGLLDIAVAPDFANNSWIYITYSSQEGDEEGGNTALMRAKFENGKLTNRDDLYKAEPNTTKGQHFGSRIVFDQEEHLFFSIGDRGNRDENPQDITRDGGKVYRLNLDGSIPEDNPFVGEENAKEAIYSYGHRNPQGMILNDATGEVWVNEHGPKGGDEINIVKPGKNYGWPVVTYGENYDGTTITEERTGPEFQNPVTYWRPSIAPSGFEKVTSNKYPDLKGGFLVGSLKFQYLEYLKIEDNKVTKREKLLEGLGRVRDVQQGPDNFIYVAVEGTGVIKLLPLQENK